MTRQQITEVVAQAYCYPDTAKHEMDSEVCLHIIDDLMLIIEKENQNE